MKKITAFIFIIALFGSVTAYAQSTTVNFAANKKGRFVPTQDGYLPDRNITTLGLNKPENICFGKNDILYIADTGNKRILLFDINSGDIVREILYEGFKSPRGVFITTDETLYVADSAAGSSIYFQPQGRMYQNNLRACFYRFRRHAICSLPHRGRSKGQYVYYRRGRV